MQPGPKPGSAPRRGRGHPARGFSELLLGFRSEAEAGRGPRRRIEGELPARGERGAAGGGRIRPALHVDVARDAAPHRHAAARDGELESAGKLAAERIAEGVAPRAVDAPHAPDVLRDLAVFEELGDGAL